MGHAHSSWETQVELPVGYLIEDSAQMARLATLRKMTGKEEALLSDPRLQGNGGKLITALLANCLTSLEGVRGVDEATVQNMYSADRNYLLLELRRLTFGDVMQARYHCPECQATNPVWEDLSQLELRPASGGAATEMGVTLRDGYRDPDGNWQYELVFALPTGLDEEVAAGLRDKNPVRQRDALLARCLRKVGDLESRRVTALGTRILADLSLADRRLIEKKLDENTFGPDLTRHIICDQCGAEYRSSLDMTNFFSLA